jgi:predicted CoA-binding protein
MSMKDQKRLIEKYVYEPVWAVVGASNNRAKYGNRIYLKLRESGYRVFPVNNREQLIEGDRAYSSLLDLPDTPAVVNMVVPPQAASVVVEQARAAGAQAIWFQPGAENAAAIRWAQDHGLDVIESCILVQLALRPSTWEASSDPPPDRESRVPSPDPTTSTR